MHQSKKKRKSTLWCNKNRKTIEKKPKKWGRNSFKTLKKQTLNIIWDDHRCTSCNNKCNNNALSKGRKSHQHHDAIKVVWRKIEPRKWEKKLLENYEKSNNEYFHKWSPAHITLPSAKEKKELESQKRKIEEEN
jgi:hypothetical protein